MVRVYGGFIKETLRVIMITRGDVQRVIDAFILQ